MSYHDCPLPILGFCAFSGTGKTTLLTQLIPLLVANGVRIAMIKHAHQPLISTIQTKTVTVCAKPVPSKC